MERHEFDADYIRRLTSGETAVAEHFTEYFQSLLRIKLYRHGWSGSDIDDICQDTFLRVLQTLHTKGIEHPERIGAFVVSVCNHVALEKIRDHKRHPSVDVNETEPVDHRSTAETFLITQERKTWVLTLLKKMRPDDARILRMLLEDVDRDEICKRMSVRRENLRVKLHRALANFKKLADRTSAAAESGNRET